MARVAPASESFWAMPQAMLRLLARPKTTATLPLRSIIVERVPFKFGCELEDSSRKEQLLSLQEIALAGREDDRRLILFDCRFVEQDAATVSACVLGVVQGLVGAGEKSICHFPGSGLCEADADGEGNCLARYGKLTHRLLDTRGDCEGF